jgi:hypothetical protein
MCFIPNDQRHEKLFWKVLSGIINIVLDCDIVQNTCTLYLVCKLLYEEKMIYAFGIDNCDDHSQYAFCIVA